MNPTLKAATMRHKKHIGADDWDEGSTGARRSVGLIFSVIGAVLTIFALALLALFRDYSIHPSSHHPGEIESWIVLAITIPCSMALLGIILFLLIQRKRLDDANTSLGSQLGVYRKLMEQSGIGYCSFQPSTGVLEDWSIITLNLLGIEIPSHSDDEDSPVLRSVRISCAGNVYHSLQQFAHFNASPGALVEGTLSTAPAASHLRFICRFPEGEGANPVLILLPPESHQQQEMVTLHQRLQLALKLGSIGYYDWNPIASSFGYSPNLPAMRGFGSETRISGISQLLERVHPEDHPKVWGLIDDHLNQRANSNSVDFRVLQTDGTSYRWIREILWASYANDGRCRQVFAANLDIDKMITRQEELRQAMADASASNRSKNEFLANMSHEIRTPLNAILGFSDIIAKESTQPPLAQYARTIGKSGRQLLGMLDSILTLAKIDAGRVEVKNEVLSLFSLAREMEMSFGPKAKKKGLEFHIDPVPDVPAELRGDRELTAKVLSTVVENAVKFSEQGGIRLNFAMEPMDEHAAWLIVTVEDDGIGMNSDALQAMTALFTQGQQDNRRKYGGTGSGLTLAHRILELMGGEISVRPTHGSGTGMIIKFPLVLEHTPGVQPNARPAAEWSGSGEEEATKEAFQDLGVMVVDDNESNRALVQNMLKELGCPIFAAANGEQALDAFSAFEPTLLLLDIHMPIMDGWELLSRLEAKLTDTTCRIVLMSAEEPRELVNHKGASLANDYLLKPFTRDDLLRQMKLAAEMIQNKHSNDHSPEEGLTMPAHIREYILTNHAQEFHLAKSRMRLQDIMRFAAAIQTDSRDYLSSPLYRTSTKLIQAAERFDINEMSNFMTVFEKMIEKNPYSGNDTSFSPTGESP